MDCLIMNSEIIKNKDKSIDINKLEKKENFKAIRINKILLSFLKKEIKEKKKNLNLFFSSCVEQKEESNKSPSKKNLSNNYDYNSGETFVKTGNEESLENDDSSSDKSCEEEINL